MFIWPLWQGFFQHKSFYPFIRAIIMIDVPTILSLPLYSSLPPLIPLTAPHPSSFHHLLKRCHLLPSPSTPNLPSFSSFYFFLVFPESQRVLLQNVLSPELQTIAVAVVQQWKGVKFTSDISIFPSPFSSNFCINSFILSLNEAFEGSWKQPNMSDMKNSTI